LFTTALMAAVNTEEVIQRVGSRLACKCGCSHTVAGCDMIDCGFSKPAKLRIAKLAAQGVSDQAIIDQFVAEYGQGIYRAAPNVFGWLVPYLMLLPGLAAIWLFIRRYSRPRPVAELGPVDAEADADLAKYGEQIEKDISRLD
jgi:cytochrome c-type biogenesis protein CcmH/NrfF